MWKYCSQNNIAKHNNSTSKLPCLTEITNAKNIDDKNRAGNHVSDAITTPSNGMGKNVGELNDIDETIFNGNEFTANDEHRLADRSIYSCSNSSSYKLQNRPSLTDAERTAGQVDSVDVSLNRNVVDKSDANNLNRLKEATATVEVADEASACHHKALVGGTTASNKRLNQHRDAATGDKDAATEADSSQVDADSLSRVRNRTNSSDKDHRTTNKRKRTSSMIVVYLEFENLAKLARFCGFSCSIEGRLL